MVTDEKSSKGKDHVEVHDDTLEDRANVGAFEAATIATGALEASYPLFSLGMIRLYGCLLIGYFCATMNGFDGSVMGFASIPQS